MGSPGSLIPQLKSESSQLTTEASGIIDLAILANVLCGSTITKSNRLSRMLLKFIATFGIIARALDGRAVWAFQRVCSEKCFLLNT